MEKEPGEWGFKALKQIVKLHLKHGDYEDMLITYRQLLKYVSSAVTRNYSEKVLNSIIDAVSVSPNAMFRQEFYETTLCTLEDDKNARRPAATHNLRRHHGLVRSLRWWTGTMWTAVARSRALRPQVNCRR